MCVREEDGLQVAERYANGERGMPVEASISILERHIALTNTIMGLNVERDLRTVPSF